MIHPNGEDESRSENSILIVDDTVANLLAFSAILRPVCPRILLAGSGKEALALASEEQFAVILLDVRMPEMNGFELAGVLRTGGRNRETPILFLSAYETPPHHVLSSFVGGTTEFLSCPVDVETLVRRVTAHLKPATNGSTAVPKMDGAARTGDRTLRP